MKVVCIYDHGVTKDMCQHAMKAMPKAQCVYGPVGDLGLAPGVTPLRVIEVEGPQALKPPETFAENPDTEIAIGCIPCPFSRAVIESMPKLRVIGLTRGGIENIDMDAAREKEILVVNALGRNAEAVSDYTMALMLSEVRSVARSYAEVRQGKWPKEFVSTPYAPHMRHLTIGIVGFGMIGTLVSKKLKGFDVKICVYDPWVPAERIEECGGEKTDSLEEMFEKADIITLHARLSDQTRGMIHRGLLERMKPTAYLINTARSGLVDMDALLELLQNKRIGGAGIDVFDQEPLPQDSPWLYLDNATITSTLQVA